MIIFLQENEEFNKYISNKQNCGDEEHSLRYLDLYKKMNPECDNKDFIHQTCWCISYNVTIEGNP